MTLYREEHIPEGTPPPPQPIAAANTRLVDAATALSAALENRRAAEAAAKEAPRVDADAAVAAVRSGEDPERPTAPMREAELEIAREREQAARVIAHSASIDLERAIRAHRDEWLPAVRQAAHDDTQAALAAVDDLAATLDRLARSSGMVRHLQTEPTGRVIEAARAWKMPVVGYARGRAGTATRLLAELRESIAGHVPPAPPTAEERAEQDARRDQAEAWRKMARQGGGVHV